MEIKKEGGTLILNKEITALDSFVIQFCRILNKAGIKYVIMSGYVSILFGRNRASEDVDAFIEKLDFATFTRLWDKATAQFTCLTGDAEDAYHNYLKAGLAVRLAKKDNYIPNFEIKFPKADIDNWTLDNKQEMLLNGESIFISPMELQIPYKLFLGSEKDIEDARYLYGILKEKLDKRVFNSFIEKLKIQKALRYLQ